MSGFSPDWLALRELADHRARNDTLADTLKARLLQRQSINVIDLGCGTGSNLRATAALLPDIQHWTLVDHDPLLLAAAATALIAWADHHEHATDGGTLHLTKGSAKLTVRFHTADLTANLDAVLDLPPKVDLVTASALFDLASPAFIRHFAQAVAHRGAIFYTVLTYNGIQRWTPRFATDQAMNGAFHAHQMRDKGFGPSAGPTAPVELAEQFQTHGYMVEEGDSPWLLDAPRDAALIGELVIGFASAVRETKALTPAEIDRWLSRPRTGAEVGHTDTLAFPADRPLTSADDD